MISECLQGINEPTEINSFYNQESPYPYPKLMICPDLKLEQQNQDIIHNYLDNHPVDECGNFFNVRNLNDSGLLQAGYAKNIDLDSELKRINHYDDKCFYDNYKKNPNESEKCNGLKENADLLVKDYSIMGKFESDGSTFNCKNGNPNDRDRFNWSKHLVNNINCNKPVNTFDRCYDVVPMESPVTYSLLDRQTNPPDYYSFNQDSDCNNYPCQKAFYNFTRRSTLPNFHNVNDINPKYLQ